MHHVTLRRGPVSLLLAALLLTFLAGCKLFEPPAPRLTAPRTLNGVTSASVQVQAEGAWRLEASGPQAANNVTLYPAVGSGDATVTLSVNPTGLGNDPDHQFTLRLVSGQQSAEATVTFSFPDVTGRVVMSPSQTALPSAARQPLASAPEFSAQQLADVTAADGTVTLLVGLGAAGLPSSSRPGAIDAQALSSLAQTVTNIAGATIESRFDEAALVFVQVPAAQAAAAAGRIWASTGVRYVELPVPLYSFSNDEFRDLQWNLDRTHVEALWNDTDGTGVTIAILDNGFYPAHPDLINQVVGQYDAGDLKADVTATSRGCGTHGTHVAGIAAAQTNNAIGVAGAAPGAGLYLVDLDYETRSGCPMDSASLIQGLQHIINGGAPLAQVANMSIGASQPLGASTEAALTAARQAGIILVGAAGNTQCTAGANTNVPVSYPAAYPQVWAVGATDRNDERACYSHVGSQLFIAAPGGDEWTNPSRPSTDDTILSTDYDTTDGAYSYGWMQGTSMASPLVAGVVALLKAAEPGASDEQIRQELADSAIDLGATGRDEQFGYGLINPLGAYAALTDSTPPPPQPGYRVRIRAPDYPDSFLESDGIFTLMNAPMGLLTVTAESDDNGNGVYGEPGEYRGAATIDVRFNQPNTVNIYMSR